MSSAAVLGVLIAVPGALGGGTAAAAVRHPAASVPGTHRATAADTTDAALARARRTGKDVPVTAATTDSSTLTAHPNGSLTLTQSVAPVRKRVRGAWARLDPALRRTADGAVTTTVSTSGLTLSDGGRGPLATMDSDGTSLALTLPMTLPRPVLSGPTATYRNVLPGVDLRATADAQGDFSEVLVVHDAKAAADPALKTLKLATRTHGVTVTGDAGGNIRAVDRSGRALFTATAPMMWDSATKRGAAARAVHDPITGQEVDRASGLPVDSSATAAGIGAHSARLAARVARGTIDLTPAASVLTGPSVHYPVYIDPNFTAPSAGSSRQAWTQINSYYNTSSYWKSSDLLRVGDQDWQSPTFTAQSFVRISVPSQIYGATVGTSQLNLTEEWSPSCTATPVQLWQSSGISSTTTWSTDRPTLSTLVDTETAANGWDSSCPAAGVGFNIKSAMQNAANGKWSNITFGLKAGDESDPDGWKEFANTVSVSTTYDHVPNTPAALTTSPSTSCQDDTLVGDGGVTLHAGVSDPDGGTVGTHFQLWPHGSAGDIVASSNPNTLTDQSGDTAVYTVTKTALEAAAGGKVTEFDWDVQVTDFNNDTTDFPGFNPDSAWSATCHFSFDPTRPGSPAVTTPADGTTTVGQPWTTAITPAPGAATTPSSYEYQLNSGAPMNVTADSSGNASITITPSRRTNVLTVTSLSAGSNYGDSASIVFNSAPPATPQADGDLSGDGVPDLLTVGGGGSGLPSGAWVADGLSAPGATTGNGAVNATAADIGANGNGSSTSASPSEFDGAQVVTGQFTDSGFQDALVYYPPSSTNADATGGMILAGNGDGSPFPTTSGTTTAIPAGSLEDINNDNPLQVVNAGDTSGNDTGYPDLLGVSGDSADGYGLDLYQAQGGIPADYQFPQTLTTPAGGTLDTPDGTTDWNDWTLASTQLSGGTALFLWNSATGQLDLWENLSFNASTGALGHTPYQLAATNWDKGASLSLQAADINGDGTPDLWTVGTGGAVTANLVSGLTTAGPATIATVSGTLAPAAHNWPLNDAANGAITTAADTTGGTGALTATATGDAVWETGGQFSPAASLNDVSAEGYSGTPNGYLATSGPAVATNGDFSVSAWVDPQTLGTYVLGQDGTHASAFAVYTDAATKTWRFEMPTSDAASPTENVATASTLTAQIGAWTHLAVTYQQSTGLMTLYVNGLQAATATHTGAWNATGAFTIGAYKSNGSRAGYFSGDIADVRTYGTALTAPQVAAVAGVPYIPAGTVTAEAAGDFNGATLGGHPLADVAHLYSCGGQCDDITVAYADANGDGGFGPTHLAWNDPDFGPGIQYMTAGDFNGDGLTDLALYYHYTTGTGQQDAVYLLTARPGGGFNTPVNVWPGSGSDSFGPGVTAIAAGDFNKDGKADLALFYHYTTGTGQEDAVFTMTAGGTTATPTLTGPAQAWDNTTFGPGVQYMSSGDFNGDGKPDLALYYHYSDDNGQHDGLFTMTGNGTGGIAAPVQAWSSTDFGPGVNNMAVGDFNGDGKSDIALFYDYSTGGNGNVALFTTNGNTFDNPTNVWAQSDWGPNTQYMDTGDFNGDGKSDIALYYDYVQESPAEFTLTADTDGDGGFADPVLRYSDE